MDAAYNFREGVGLNMPAFARVAVEDWGMSTSVSARGSEPKDGVIKLSYSEHSNSSKNIWFDLNCDIAEGKRRTEERQAGLERYNRMMEMSCIQLSPDSLDPKKLYTVQQLDRGDNTGKYAAKSENIPGYVLQDRLREGYVRDILSAKPMDIQPDLIYEVSNFFHRPSAELLADDRVIQCGNWKCIVLGKALMELISEQQYLPTISAETHEYGPTIQEAEKKLQRFASGSSHFFVNNATNYKESLDRLHSEYHRAAGNTRSLDDIISGAAARTSSSKTSVEREPDFQR